MTQTEIIAIVVALIVIFAGLYLWDKKKKKLPTFEEKHDRFDELLQEKIDHYRQREQPKLGERYIRREIDNLYETGYLKPQILKDEYNRIVSQKSTLPLSQRQFIKNIIHATAIELDQEIKEGK